ncbi:MAG: hypothetical protein ACRD15_01280, partial [Vicinamibacterales bacterium]
DEREALALTNHEMLECELSTISTARAEINDIKVGVQPFPVLKVGRLSGVLHATSPDASDEPCIELGKDSDVTGVFIDTFGLEVILNRDLYQTCDTRSKLVSASSDPSFVDQQGVSLRAAERADAATLTSTAGASADRRCPERPPSKDLLYATIVRELRWIGQEPPRSFARIDGHTVVVEDFGTIYFGEIVIRAASRHLTMLRLELGSPLGGGVSASSVGQSEGWVP